MPGKVGSIDQRELRHADFWTRFGEVVRQARVAAGVTQVELSKRVGIGRMSLTHLESGHRRVPVNELVAIARELNVTVGALLGDEGTSVDYEVGFDDGFNKAIRTIAATLDDLRDSR